MAMQPATEDQVKLVYQFLKQSFRDKINGFKKLDIDPETREVTGVFRSGDQLMRLKISGDGSHSYGLMTGSVSPDKQVAPDKERAALASGQKVFDSVDWIAEVASIIDCRLERERMDAKKCDIGTPCGGTCIESEDECRAAMTKAEQRAWENLETFGAWDIENQKFYETTWEAFQSEAGREEVKFEERGGVRGFMFRETMKSFAMTFGLAATFAGGYAILNLAVNPKRRYL